MRHSFGEAGLGYFRLGKAATELSGGTRNASGSRRNYNAASHSVC